MKALLTLTVFATAVWAAPTNFEGYSNVVEKFSKNVVREKKAPTLGLLSSRNIDSSGIVPILTTPVHSRLELAPFVERAHKPIKKPVKIHKPHHPYHHYGHFRDTSEQTLEDEHQHCKEESEQLKSCMIKNSKSAVIEEQSTREPTNNIADNLRMAKEAVYNIERMFGILETSDKKIDTEQGLQREIEIVKQAIEQVQRNIKGTQNDTQRFAQWKNEKEEIQNTTNDEPQNSQSPVIEISNQNVSLTFGQEKPNIEDSHEEKRLVNFRSEIEDAVKVGEKTTLQSVKNNNSEEKKTEFNSSSSVMYLENALPLGESTNTHDLEFTNSNANATDNNTLQISGVNEKRSDLDGNEITACITNSSAKSEDSNDFSTLENNTNISDEGTSFKKSKLNEIKDIIEEGVNISKGETQPSMTLDNLKDGSLQHNLKSNDILSIQEESSERQNSQSHSIQTMSLKSVMDDNEHVFNNQKHISDMKINEILNGNSDSETATSTKLTQQLIETLNKSREIQPVQNAKAMLLKKQVEIVNPELENAFLTKEENAQIASSSASQVKNVMEPFEVKTKSNQMSTGRRTEAKRNSPPKTSARGADIFHYGYGSVPEAGGSAIGVFPYAKEGGCAVPILMGCSPSVTAGSLAEHQSAYTSPGFYRTE